jgi:hypothetical protein
MIKSRRMRWTRLVAHIKMRDAYKMLTRISEGKRPLARPRHIWKDDMKMVLKEIGCKTVDSSR